MPTRRRSTRRAPTRPSLTTLQLARAIATAVIRAQWHYPARRHRDATRDAPTQAVLQTLTRHDAWFCRGARVDNLEPTS